MTGRVHMCRAAGISYSVVAGSAATAPGRPSPSRPGARPPDSWFPVAPTARPAPSYAACLNKWCGEGRPPRPGSSPHESRLLRGPSAHRVSRQVNARLPPAPGSMVGGPGLLASPRPPHPPRPLGRVRIRKFVAWCPARLTRPPGALGHLSLHCPGADPAPAPGDGPGHPTHTLHRVTPGDAPSYLPHSTSHKWALAGGWAMRGV